MLLGKNTTENEKRRGLNVIGEENADLESDDNESLNAIKGIDKYNFFNNVNSLAKPENLSESKFEISGPKLLSKLKILII